MSGRALFEFDSTIFVDDENAADQKIYEDRVIEEDEEE